MIHISLFSGIGGFDLASEWIGWTNAMSCEINPFCKKILEYYWPSSYHHDDIKTLNYEKIDNELTKRFGDWKANDIILTGGFPCQPYSLAGKRLGKEDERHLWPEMLRVIQLIKPKYIVGENVSGIISWNGGLVFNEVCIDLENEGYEVQPIVLPAASVNAPHKRDRVWFVAYSNNQRGGSGLREIQGKDEEISQWNDNAKLGNTGYDKIVTNTESQSSQRLQFEQRNISKQEQGKFRGSCGGLGDGIVANTNNSLWGQKLNQWAEYQQEKRTKIRNKFVANGQGRFIAETTNGRRTSRIHRTDWQNFPTQSPVCSRDDGFPFRLDNITFPKWRTESLKGYGNAIVPQVAYEIFKVINKLQ